MNRPSKLRARLLLIVAALCGALMGCALVGCGGGQSTSSAAPSPDPAASTQTDSGCSTSGPQYVEPDTVVVSVFDSGNAEHIETAAIDTSTCDQGYVGVSATASSRLKFQVVNGEQSYNYDLPNDDTPIIVPMNMGDGEYKFRVMQNTSGTSYVELASTTANVQLKNEFAPFLHPNLYCDYTPQSACVKKAFELCADAQNEGDVARAIYDWIVNNVTYDDAKAAQLATSTGYVPDPDDTYTTGIGICFDYASLAAAMFRSLGIPCQIITGYVSPDDIYHAWNMIYIDGEWVCAEFSIDPDKWNRIDLTFAAGGASSTIGDGTFYTERYVY